jgi:hypothetical protein
LDRIIVIVFTIFILKKKEKKKEKKKKKKKATYGPRALDKKSRKERARDRFIHQNRNHKNQRKEWKRERE